MNTCPRPGSRAEIGPSVHARLGRRARRDGGEAGGVDRRNDRVTRARNTMPSLASVLGNESSRALRFSPPPRRRRTPSPPRLGRSGSTTFTDRRAPVSPPVRAPAMPRAGPDRGLPYPLRPTATHCTHLCADPKASPGVPALRQHAAAAHVRPARSPATAHRAGSASPREVSTPASATGA